MGRNKSKLSGEFLDPSEEIKGTKELSQTTKEGNEREFLFGLSLHLGKASNNYAEYTGVILSQLVFSMFKQKQIAIRTDSMLIVNQVKGVAQTKNFRLVEMIKIVSFLFPIFQYKLRCILWPSNSMPWVWTTYLETRIR
jgi:hypothetical protein